MRDWDTPRPILAAPRVIDNDRDEITVMLGGAELRGWSYASDLQRRAKLFAAREFVEGWHQGRDDVGFSRGFVIGYALLAALAGVCLTAGLFLLHSHYPAIGAPL